MADRKITDLTALTTPASADVLPIVDVSEAAAADKNKKITVGELFKGVPDGSAAAPAIAFETDDGNGLFLSTTDTIGIATNGVSRATVSTTAVTSTLPVIVPNGSAAAPSVAFTGSGTDTGLYSPGADQVAISTNGAGRLFVDASGNVGVKTGSPSVSVEVARLGGAWAGTAPPAGTALFVHPGGGTSTSPAHITLGAGNAATCAIYFSDGDSSSRGAVQYDHSVDALQLYTAGSERMRLDSSGRLGLGTSSVDGNWVPKLQVTSTASDGTGGILIESYKPALTFKDLSGGAPERKHIWADDNKFYFGSGDVAQNAQMTLTSTGLGIGTQTPGALLTVAGASGTGINLDFPGGIATGTEYSTLKFTASNPGFTGAEIRGIHTNGGANLGVLALHTSGSEKARIDSSGRLLVGTSTARSDFYGASLTSPLQIEGTSFGTASISVTRNQTTGGAGLMLGATGGSSNGSTTLVSNGATLGGLIFQGTDGSKFVPSAEIACQVDGTPGTNDMPGRLVFSTTADGASSPTERLRIDSAGQIIFGSAGTASGVSTGNTAWIDSGSAYYGAVAGNTVAYFNRNTNDGTIVELRQANTVEGTISVSGTTVSYNGAHLSRWSQLPGGAVREEILRGTVLSNIDEMCAWGDEDNEQLNRMKVSDVEGDPNVAGVFQAWDDDDDTYTDDFYCAMTGDFIIRIAEGVTVQRGDLLMSAGDGTAKPQDDDIIRSKTIAKVTSTHVSETYADGSYCVPCVLMAC